MGYGGYSEQSWDLKKSRIDDPFAFLYVVRPKVKVFGLREKEKKGISAMWNLSDYGPVYGKGCDIYIQDKCNTATNNGTHSLSFNWSGNELSGGKKVGKEQHCRVIDYEVF